MGWLKSIAAIGACLGALAGVMIADAPAFAQERKPGPIGPQSGPYREQEWLLPWERQPGQIFLAHAKVYRPEGEGKQPLALLAHGAPPRSMTARR